MGWGRRGQESAADWLVLYQHLWGKYPIKRQQEALFCFCLFVCFGGVLQVAASIQLQVSLFIFRRTNLKFKALLLICIFFLSWDESKKRKRKRWLQTATKEISTDGALAAQFYQNWMNLFIFCINKNHINSFQRFSRQTQ